jgi:hypothetical protein
MRLRIAFLALLTTALQAPAQATIDLTGKPNAVIKDAFSMISGVRGLPGNRAIVTDQLERLLYLVDFTTGARRQIGRQGAGPAEYRFPMAPFAAPDDRTLILDASLRRVHVINPDGTFGASLSPPYTAVPGGLLSARGVDASGRMYFEGNSFNSETGGFIDSVGVIRWNPSNNEVEILGKVWSGGRVRITRAGSPASVSRQVLPFPHVDAWTVLSNGRVAVVRQEPYQIAFLEAGSLRPAAPVAFTPIPVTAAERDAYREEHSSNRMSATGGNQSIRAPAASDAEFPPAMPAFVFGSVVASDSSIWVGRSHRATDRTWQYDVFDATGRRIATAVLPRNSRIAAVQGGMAYIARTDPNDGLVYLERRAVR